MALLSFPGPPLLNGQLYPTSPLPGQNQYEWDAANQTWRLLGAATGVTPGTYGDSTNVGQFTVDATGRILSAVNVAIASAIPDLQSVTTQGAVSTDTIDVGGLVAAGLTYPVADGAAGNVLTTDGAGTLSFVAPLAEDLQAVTDNGNTTTNSMRFYDSVTTNEAVRIDPDSGTIEIFPQSVGNSGLILSPTAVSFGNSIGSIGATGLVPSSIEFDGSAGVRINSGLGTAPIELRPGGAATVSTDSIATTISNQLVASGLSYPVADGAAGDVMVTDGAGTLSFVAAPTEDLQSVTDNGATTTNTITLNKTGTSDTALVVRNGVGKAISVQGSGNIEFLSPSGGQFYSSIVPGFETLSFVVANGPLPEAIKINSLSTDINNQLVASGLSYPVADGTADQVLATDGAGVLGWLSTLKVVAAPTTQSDPGVAGDVAYNASYFYWHDGTDWQRVAAEPPGW